MSSYQSLLPWLLWAVYSLRSPKRSNQEWSKYCVSHCTIIWKLACWFHREACLESQRVHMTYLPSKETYQMALLSWIRTDYRHWKIPILFFSFANPRITYRRDWLSLSYRLRNISERCCLFSSSNFPRGLRVPVRGPMRIPESTLSLLFRWFKWWDAAWSFLYLFLCL